ncbi:heterogeneous nuclear ribonucleoprotein 1-like [Malania oleifera]|uniref:heterogeneous nuclear ribonucleoprotein 1-like n=1 Tax=Malania oleifera TaxID=397392 RepID=UPI0025AE7945|nr:heterogeneous nuclear ribonucleoprotein 1-like [Malania oleifera]
MESENGKLFVGGVSRETNEEALKAYFAKFGEVEQTLVMRDRNTGHGRGFGFVTFSDPSVTEKVLQEKHRIQGRTVDVKRARPKNERIQGQHHSLHHHHNNGFSGNTHNGFTNNQFTTKKIFVGGLPSSLTKEEFRSYFESFGNITDVVVIYDRESHRPRGFGFITFDSEEAVDNVLQKRVHELNNKLVEVRRAEPKDRINRQMANDLGYGRGFWFGSFGIYSPYASPSSVYPAGALPYGNTTAAICYGLNPYGVGNSTIGYDGVGYGGFSAVPPRGFWDGFHRSQGTVPYGNSVYYPTYMDGGAYMCSWASWVPNGDNGSHSSSGILRNLNKDDGGGAEVLAVASPPDAVASTFSRSSNDNGDGIHTDVSATTNHAQINDISSSQDSNNVENRSGNNGENQSSNEVENQRDDNVENQSGNNGENQSSNDVENQKDDNVENQSGNNGENQSSNDVENQRDNNVENQSVSEEQSTP